MQNSLKTEQKIFQQPPLRLTHPKGPATVTCEMTLQGRGTALVPVPPDEAPQLEAAKEDSSLPWLFGAKENGIRQLIA